MYKLVFSIFLLLFSSQIRANSPDFTFGKSMARPHRVIRTCCSFGTEMKLMALPGIKITEITSIEKIGPHKYLGDKEEGNGIIYSLRGGFIDMAHLRDQSDWTAYLYAQILNSKPGETLNLELGYEGGEKTLSVFLPRNATKNDKILLAGRIAYDLSVWHEIATWFGASTIPFVPERYSSFSIEDPYSNLLGVTIGIQALQSDLPYEQAVSKLIDKYLRELESVSNESETYLAMESVRNIWWTRDKKFPSSKVLMQRQLDVYPCLRPWLVPGWKSHNEQSSELLVPQFASTGQSLSHFYRLEFKLNYKFPFRKMFPDRKDRSVTQNDFQLLISRVNFEISQKSAGLPKRN